MNASLSEWIGHAEALRQLTYFRATQSTLDLQQVRSRSRDYYISLVGELFDQMRADNRSPTELARLANALSHFAAADRDEIFPSSGVSSAEAALFAASAFYCGGFPASAYLIIQKHAPSPEDEDLLNACFDLLARPAELRSDVGRVLLAALRDGDTATIHATHETIVKQVPQALRVGPGEWIGTRLLEQLLARFVAANIRSVLPFGDDEFWSPLVGSFLDRTPPTWEFFPSQIAAIQRGLIERATTYSLQMPTGAGKTALCETLLYWHARQTPEDVAVLLVPYRSLASELRGTLVKRLNHLGISARCAYGGTVPSGDEVNDLDGLRVIVATPEALTGLLTADPEFFLRIALVICDEGHLLDSARRGVSLELLLARMRARRIGPPRFVFMSAIIPNIDEINAWLGGDDTTLVRTDYKPAAADFAVLRSTGRRPTSSVALEMHPHEDRPTRFSIPSFLGRRDFRWTNAATGRQRTYSFHTIKTRAVATARKAMAMGPAAVFAANKLGTQGAIGLATELLRQLEIPLPLPEPTSVSNDVRVQPAMQYLEMEYGPEWTGTKMIRAGAVLHHGDIPQETREVVEGLLRSGAIQFVICTQTLAEGVNLPIRTLVLYSVQRRQPSGATEKLLARDIKNLVGRAGRPGSSTRGLVICANEGHWPMVEVVALQAPTEPVLGALRRLVEKLLDELALQTEELTNESLETAVDRHSLIDGIDTVLMDLAAEEIGENALAELAVQLADHTFALRQPMHQSAQQLLRDIFALRSTRIAGLQATGRIAWMRETGTRPRLLESIEHVLLPGRASWSNVVNPVDPEVVDLLLTWAWTQPELGEAIHRSYKLDADAPVDSALPSFRILVTEWLSGRPFAEVSARSGLNVDELLAIHTTAVAFVFQTLVEQAVALLEKLVEARGDNLAAPVVQFPDHVRFGVPTGAGRVLSVRGVRHRRAAVELGNALDGRVENDDEMALFQFARNTLFDDRDEWRGRLGILVFENTIRDLDSLVRNRGA